MNMEHFIVLIFPILFLFQYSFRCRCCNIKEASTSFSNSRHGRLEHFLQSNRPYFHDNFLLLSSDP